MIGLTEKANTPDERSEQVDRERHCNDVDLVSQLPTVLSTGRQTAGLLISSERPCACWRRPGPLRLRYGSRGKRSSNTLTFEAKPCPSQDVCIQSTCPALRYNLSTVLASVFELRPWLPFCVINQVCSFQGPVFVPQSPGVY